MATLIELQSYERKMPLGEHFEGELTLIVDMHQDDVLRELIRDYSISVFQPTGRDEPAATPMLKGDAKFGLELYPINCDFGVSGDLQLIREKCDLAKRATMSDEESSQLIEVLKKNEKAGIHNREQGVTAYMILQALGDETEPGDFYKLD